MPASAPSGGRAHTLRFAGLVWRIEGGERERFPDAYAGLFEAMRGDERAAEVLRSSRRKKVFRQPAPGDPAAYAYLKVYDRPGLAAFASPPALREARAMQYLPRLDVTVPRVVARGSSPRLRLRGRSALLTVTPARFRNLGLHAHRILEAGQGSRPAFLEDLGSLHRLLRRMHDVGFFHGDLNLGNVLYDPASREFCFVDFHRSSSSVRGRMRLRAADLSKLREFFARDVAAGEWDELLDKHYFAGDATLRARVLRDWEDVRRARAARKIEGTVRNALDGKHHFARQQADGATVTFSREAGIAPERLVALARSGGEGRVVVLGRYEAPSRAREAFGEAVRRAAAGEPGPMPLACVELAAAPGSHGAVVLALEGPEPAYSLRRVFSLERFAEPEAAR